MGRLSAIPNAKNTGSHCSITDKQTERHGGSTVLLLIYIHTYACLKKKARA